jgi:hypothetical protein
VLGERWVTAVSGNGRVLAEKPLRDAPNERALGTPKFQATHARQLNVGLSADPSHGCWVNIA